MIGCSSCSAVGTRSSFGVFDDQVVDEGLMHGDVDVFVDRRGDQEAAMVAIVGRQIGAAAAERDAKGTERTMIMARRSPRRPGRRS